MTTSSVFDTGSVIGFINGVKIEGLSEDEDAIQNAEEEVGVVKRGMQGDSIMFTNGNKGGVVVFKFLPTSPTAAWLSKRMELQTHGIVTIYNVTITVPSILYEVKMQGGLMFTGQKIPSIGKGSVSNQNFTFDFNNISSNQSTSAVGSVIGQLGAASSLISQITGLV